MRVRVYCMPVSMLIREKTCALSTRCSRCEVTANNAMNMTNMKIEVGVTAVLLISKSLKFKKYSTNSITSDNFIGHLLFLFSQASWIVLPAPNLFLPQLYIWRGESYKTVTCSSYGVQQQTALRKSVETPQPICYRTASVICGSTSMRRPTRNSASSKKNSRSTTRL